MRHGFYAGQVVAPQYSVYDGKNQTFTVSLRLGGVLMGKTHFFVKMVCGAQDSLLRDYTDVRSLWLKSADSV